ncbi:MAG: hypothetical protein ACC742_11090 [Thermoanaerobaculales bacterium]
MLRFHPGEAGQSCSACGFRFSDVDVTTRDTMNDVWTRKGFRCKRFIAWSDVGSVQTETTNGMFTDLLLLPHGAGGGIFNLRRYRCSLRFIPGKKKELYAAEFFFWLQRAQPAAGTATIGQALSG